jgi:hypothetical protein
VTDEHHFATPMDTTICLLHGISSHRGERSSSRRQSTFALLPIQLDNHSSSALSIEKTMPSINSGPFSDQEHTTYLVERDQHRNLYPDYNMPWRTTDQIETHAIQHYEKNNNDRGQPFEQAIAKTVGAYPTTVVANPMARRPRTKFFTKRWTPQEDVLYLIEFRKYGNQFSKYNIPGHSPRQCNAHYNIGEFGRRQSASSRKKIGHNHHLKGSGGVGGCRKQWHSC